MTITLITGASRGLGRSAAMHIAARGGDVIGTFASNSDAASEVASAISATGRRVAMLKLDTGRPADFPAFRDEVQKVLGDWGRDSFDHLVNNAGHGVHQSILETAEAEMDRLYAVHLKGPFMLTAALAPLLADGGHILNLSTGLTRFSFPGYAAYASMKGGVEVMTRYMAKEFGARGIRANTLAPGAIETDFGGGAVRDNEHLNQMIAGMTALGRTGLPDDVGAAVADILLGETRWITAQRVEVSGGMAL